MTRKSELVPQLLKKIAPRAPLPRPLKEGTLLEQGLLVVLVRRLKQSEAETLLSKLRQLYPDWNEMRVAQAQEIAGLIVAGTRRAPAEALAALIPVVRDVREYLQEVYQKVHGFDLEGYREDPAGAQKLFTQMPFLGLPGGSFLLWLCNGKQLPVHAPLVRVLERLGLVGRAPSPKKWRELVEPLVPENEDLNFVASFNEVADRWCDAKKPLCHECPLVEDCPYGRKAFQEWKVQQARLEQQRARDEAKRLELEKKESARLAKEELRERKKRELEEARRARERDKLARAQERVKQAADRQRKRLEASAKRAADEAARKAAAEARQAAAEKGRSVAARGEKAAPRSRPKPKSRSAARPASKDTRPAKQRPRSGSKPAARSGRKR